MISCPQILIQIGDACRPKRIYNSCFPAILDTGSTLNLIRVDCLPSNTKISESSISLIGISGRKLKSKGVCKICIRPLNPFTKNPICEVRRPVICQLTDDLPTPILLGTSFLNNSVIDMQKRRLLMDLGHKMAHVQFTRHSCLLIQDQQEQSDLHRALEKSILSARDSQELRIEDIKINTKLSDTEQAKIRELLQNFENCFMSRPDEVSLFKNGNHEPLKLKLASEIYTQPKAYSIPTKLHDDFAKQLKIWLDQGIVVRQNRVCEYRTNIVPVKKKDNTYRFTLDCRFINAIIQNENVAIPPTITLVRKASGYKYYTCLDLSSFFLIYKLDEESSDMLTFLSPSDGQLYKMKRTPFGLKSVMTNAILLFENELDRIPDRKEWMVSYVDDLCVFHDDLDKHLRDLERLFQVLSNICVKCKPSKTSIAYNECILFGYKLNKDGFCIDPAKYESIMKIPKPQNRKQLIRVIGQVSYYRTLLPPSQPMGYFTSKFRELVSEKNKYNWTEQHDIVWEQFKTSIKNHLTLQRLYEDDNDIVVRSDSSQTHYGGTLSAIREDKEILIFTTSKSWTPTASRYHISRLELIAALKVLDEFKMDLIGRKVTLFVDNASVYFILQNPHRISVEGTMIPKLFFEIRHINFSVKKTDNKDEKWSLVDALSRTTGKITIPSRNLKELLQIEEDIEPEHCTLLSDIKPTEIKLDNFNVMAPLFSLRNFQNIKTELENDISFKNTGEIPKEMRKPILDIVHGLGHIGPIRMASLLSNNNIHWRNRNLEIEKCVQRCEICGIFKNTNVQLSKRQAEVPVLQARHTLAIDVSTIGQPSICNFLIAVDLFTSFITALRVPGQLNSMNVAKTLLNILARYAPNCRVIRLDNASYFKTETFQRFFQTLNIKAWYVSRLNSRGNGKAERAIRSINEQLRYMKMKNYSNQDWDLALEMCTLAINLKPLYGKISPYTLTYGVMEPENDNEFTTIKNVDINKYNAVLTERIKALRDILSLYYINPTKTGEVKLHPINTLVRLKVNQQRGYNKITAPKFSVDLFRIIKVRQDTKSYSVENVQNPDDIRYTHHRHVKKVLSDKDQVEANKRLQQYEKLPESENILKLRNRSINRS